MLKPKRARGDVMNEDFVEFLKLVTVMRSSQKTYFRTRSHTALDESKILERRVDSEIARLAEYCQKPEPKQMEMF